MYTGAEYCIHVHVHVVGNYSITAASNTSLAHHCKLLNFVEKLFIVGTSSPQLCHATLGNEMGGGIECVLS